MPSTLDCEALRYVAKTYPDCLDVQRAHSRRPKFQRRPYAATSRGPDGARGV